MRTKGRAGSWEPRARAGAALGLAVAATLVCVQARAQSCEANRPTDAQGTSGLSYGGAVTGYLDSASGRARVHFAQSGVHAPSSMSTVTAAVEAADAALAKYAELGYLPVVSDATSPCASNGGGGQVDIYLADFRAADGQAVIDHCEAGSEGRRCSGFILVENDFSLGGYADAVEGMRTVVTHELFHLVQAAYDTSAPRWWSEGSAQWAAKQVYPEIVDLERFLPAYFENPERPLDGAAGVASNFLYATAIWPVFLSQRFGADLIRRVFVKMAAGEPVFDAIDAELSAEGSGLGPEFLRFAVFNVGTGAWAPEAGGYADAARYPEVPVTELAVQANQKISGIGSGLSAKYYGLRVSGRRNLSLSADPARIAASFIPIEDDAAQIDAAVALPTVVLADGIVVVAGQTPAKNDAPYALTIAADAEELESSACSLRRLPTATRTPPSLLLASIGLLALVRRRARRNSVRVSGACSNYTSHGFRPSC